MKNVEILSLSPSDFPNLAGTHYFPLKKRHKPNLPVYKITGYYLNLNGEDGESEIQEREYEARNEMDAIRQGREEGLESVWLAKLIERRH